jgi:hypothetical protein
MIAGVEIGADAFLGVEGREKEGDKRDRAEYFLIQFQHGLITEPS